MTRGNVENTLFEGLESVLSTLNMLGCSGIVTDGAGSVTKVNAIYESVSGYKTEELIGLKVWELPFTQRSEINLAWEAVMKGEGPRVVADRFTAKDGAPRALLCVIAPYHNPDDSIAGTTVTGIDAAFHYATDRTQALPTVLPYLNPNPVIQVDTEGRIVFSNDACVRILKRLGKESNLSLLLPPKLDKVLESIKSDLPTEVVSEVTVGDRVFNVQILTDPYANAARLYYSDITERKQFEARLVESEERYRQFVDANDERVFLKDEKFRYVIANKATSDYFNTTQEEIIGKTAFDLMPRDVAQRWHEEDLEVVRSGEMITSSSTTDGVSHETIKFPVRMHNGKTGIGGFVRNVTARKQAEETLVRYRLLFENARDGIILMDEDHLMVDVNPAVLRSYGYSRDEMIGRHVKMLVDHFDQETSRKVYSSADSGYSFESIHVRKDGTAFPVDMSTRPFFRDGRRYILNIIRDISERKEAHKAIEESEKRYRQLIENAMAGVCIVDTDMRMTMVNKSLAEMLGYSVEELTGMTTTDLLAPDTRAEQTIMPEDIPMDTSWHYEWRLQKKDGSELHALISEWSRHDEEGKFLGTACFVLDISERRAAERIVEESEKRYRQLIENAMDGICLLGVDGEMTLANQRLADMLGYTVDEMVGRLSTDFLTPEELATRDPIPGDMEENLCWRYASKLLKKDGAEVDVVISEWARHDESGNFLGTACFVSDVTHERQLEEQLQQVRSMEAVGHLAGGISHDFRNLLMGISGYAEIIQTKLDPDHPMQRSCGEILRCVDSGSALVNELLTFSKKQKINLESSNLNDLVSDADSILRGMLKDRVSLEIDLSPEELTVCVDVGQMERVIVNLSVNALEAMPDGGTLKIATRKVPAHETNLAIEKRGKVAEYACLEVSDTGRGMSEETLKRIYEPFYSTKKTRGTNGLGMSIVFGIVSSHKGAIEIKSREGEGSIFRVYIPITEVKECGPAQATEES
jgi:PAS domain S-box-containing protein